MTLAQYRIPAVIGDTSPAIAATIASSSSRAPASSVAVLDERLSLAEKTQRRELGIGKSHAERVGLRADGMRGQGVAAVERVVRPNDLEVATFGAVEALTVQQPLRPGKPAVALGGLAREQQGRAQPEAAARRPVDVAPVGVFVIRPRPGRVGVVVAADQVGGGAKSIEVLRLERNLGVGGRQVRERIPPGRHREGLATQLARVPDRGRSHRIRVAQSPRDCNRAPGRTE